ncbi:MAG: hypothetical protein ABJA18_13805 [bacterium]
MFIGHFAVAFAARFSHARFFIVGESVSGFSKPPKPGCNGKEIEGHPVPGEQSGLIDTGFHEFFFANRGEVTMRPDRVVPINQLRAGIMKQEVTSEYPIEGAIYDK